MSEIFLQDIHQPLTSLPGVGPRSRALLKHLVGEQVSDLLYHFPTKVVERKYFPSIRELIRCFATLPEGTTVTLCVHIDGFPETKHRGGPIRVRASDSTGYVDLAFFNSNPSYLAKKVIPGTTVLVTGRAAVYGGHLQISHPDYIGPTSTLKDFQGFEGVYPLTTGLSNQVVARVLSTALKQISEPLEWLSPEMIRKKNWPSWKEALNLLHNPQSPQDITPQSPARLRLAYDEILAQQLRLLLAREEPHLRQGRICRPTGKFTQLFLAALPFELTEAQNLACSEVRRDMGTDKRMLRLLQGDVGSGKTVVAFLSILLALEAGTQAAFLVPTEILAQQHFKTLSSWCAPLGIEIDLLTGGNNQAKARRILKEKTRNGEVQILVGTHALLEDDVEFKDLGLVVIDEQHRFGVAQRLKLMEKGPEAHILIMTATPIPRTLQLAAFGDMDISHIREKPKNRKPITTRILPIDRMEDVTEALRRPLDRSEKIYWVCSLVEESEVLDITAAEERCTFLRSIFGEEKVVLVHGRMKAQEKQEVMDKFIHSSAQILVATTVIEVGVDVKEATLMIIENAERFGLSQLHQLRGRIGRGDLASSCLLLYASPLTPVARQRLSIMRETEDGFRISEEDLKIRGAGDLLGVHQSGYDIYKLADLFEHESLLTMAQEEARFIVQKDPTLASERGQALRILLQIFYATKSLKYLLAG